MMEAAYKDVLAIYTRNPATETHLNSDKIIMPGIVKRINFNRNNNEIAVLTTFPNSIVLNNSAV